MADINWVSTLPMPAKIDFGSNSPTLVHVSPLTGAVQTVGVPGMRWVMSFSFTALTRAQSAALEVLRTQLRGQANRLICWHLGRATIRGVGGGSPAVNGAGQTGNTLALKGLPTSTTGVYLPGDLIGIGSAGQLVQVSSQCDSDGSGHATLTFEPPLRASPADSTALVTNQPTARWVLVNNNPQLWSDETELGVTGHHLDLMEVFN